MNSLLRITNDDYEKTQNYNLETFLSIFFWPFLVFILIIIFIYDLSFYEKFLKLLKKKEKPVPEIDEAKSNYRNTVYK